MQILSIDDSKTIRQTIQNLLEVIGVKFLQAEDGEKGLEVLEAVKGKVDLILLAKIIQTVGIENLEGL